MCQLSYGTTLKTNMLWYEECLQIGYTIMQIFYGTSYYHVDFMTLAAIIYIS